MSNDGCGAPAGGVTITKDKAGKEAIVEGHVLSGGDVLLCPGALVAQRSRVHGHPVTCRDPRHLVADCGDEPGRLYA